MTSIFKRMTSFTPVDDLSGQFDSPHALPDCVQRVEALDNQRYDVHGPKKSPLLFTVSLLANTSDQHGAYTAQLSAYLQTKADSVAFLDIKLIPNGETTTISYDCRLKQGHKTKIYIHLLVIIVLVILTLSVSDAVLFFGIFFILSAYAIFQEWSELRNVKEGLLTLLEQALR